MGRRGLYGLVAGLVVAVAAAAWLYRDNRALRRQLAERQPAATPHVPVAAETPPVVRPGSPARPLLEGLGSLAEHRERPSLPEPKEQTRLERRLHWEARIRNLLGRHPNESEDDYRRRVVPLIQLALLRRREQAVESWRAAREAAGLSGEQEAQLDELFQDAQSELISMTNRAIAAGDLTPYERNWSGMLDYAGGLGMWLGQTQGRIGSILSPAQLQAIYGTGFEWGEYIGVTAPWETLDPPPPPGVVGDSGG